MHPDPILSIRAEDVEARARPSLYPHPFAQRMAGRTKKALGDVFGLTNFGVNLTRLAPGATSALLHRHSRQDEFVFVLEGELTLVSDSGEAVLPAGACAGFRAGGHAHHLVNRTGRDGVYLEVGDRSPDDVASYPEDDLVALRRPEGWEFTHRDGTPYGTGQKPQLTSGVISAAAAREALAAQRSTNSEVLSWDAGTVEVYAPAASDPQKPHERDELYFIAAGRGDFLCGGVTMAFKPGDVLAVPAHVDHHFVSPAADLLVWVLFVGPVRPKPNSQETQGGQ